MLRLGDTDPVTGITKVVTDSGMFYAEIRTIGDHKDVTLVVNTHRVVIIDLIEMESTTEQIFGTLTDFISDEIPFSDDRVTEEDIHLDVDVNVLDLGLLTVTVQKGPSNWDTVISIFDMVKEQPITIHNVNTLTLPDNIRLVNQFISEFAEAYVT